MSISLGATSPRKQRKKTGPTVSILILNAISSYDAPRGVSLVALKKVLKAHGYDVARNRARIRLALRRMVAKKVIVRTRGKGVSGSFKLNPRPPSGRRRRANKGGGRNKRRRRKGKRRKSQARRARRRRSRRGRRRATPARKKSTRRRTRRAPRRKTPQKTRRVQSRRTKPAKMYRRRGRRRSGRYY
nr:protamine-like protein [Nerophis lumbriciformis]